MGVVGFLKRLRVLLTREEVVPESLPGATAVVIDVFMATTTLLTILENGAKGVYPVASLREADEVAAKLDPARVLRGGEQDAARIEGYDHGPFPEEYAPEVVENRDVIFVTTNGTRAIADAAPADTVLLGTLRNAPAVARYLEESGTDSVYFVCAGSAGRFTVEDFLGAAKILSYMDVEGWRPPTAPGWPSTSPGATRTMSPACSNRAGPVDGSSRTIGWKPSTSWPMSGRATSSPRSSKESSAPQARRAREDHLERDGGRAQGRRLRPRSSRALPERVHRRPARRRARGQPVPLRSLEPHLFVEDK